MFKVGQDVVIRESEQIHYHPPFDGVVTSVNASEVTVKFSDGITINMYPWDLEAANDDNPSLELMIEVIRNSGYLVEKL